MSAQRKLDPLEDIERQLFDVSRKIERVQNSEIKSEMEIIDLGVNQETPREISNTLNKSEKGHVHTEKSGSNKNLLIFASILLCICLVLAGVLAGHIINDDNMNSASNLEMKNFVPDSISISQTTDVVKASEIVGSPIQSTPNVSEPAIKTNKDELGSSTFETDETIQRVTTSDISQFSFDPDIYKNEAAELSDARLIQLQDSYQLLNEKHVKQSEIIDDHSKRIEAYENTSVVLANEIKKISNTNKEFSQKVSSMNDRIEILSNQIKAMSVSFDSVNKRIDTLEKNSQIDNSYRTKQAVPSETINTNNVVMAKDKPNEVNSASSSSFAEPKPLVTEDRRHIKQLKIIAITANSAIVRDEVSGQNFNIVVGDTGGSLGTVTHIDVRTFDILGQFANGVKWVITK